MVMFWKYITVTVIKTIADTTTCYCSTLIAMMKSTVEGILDKDPDTEEPDECESLKSGSGVAAGWATAPPTITYTLRDLDGRPN